VLRDSVAADDSPPQPAEDARDYSGEPALALAENGDPVLDRRVTLAEAACLGAAFTVAVVAIVSLAAAHLHHHNPGVVWTVSMVALMAVVLAVLRFDRPSIRLDRVGLLPVVVGAAISVVTMFPGFEYATGDRDPGGYVQHGVAIARSGSINFPNDLLANHLPTLTTPGAVWPGLWVDPHDPNTIFPQFYHLWPALLATAKDAGGFTGLFNTGPLLAVFGVAFAVCIGRRLAGWPGAWTSAALMSTQMLEVWQAKYPSSEIFGQFLFVGATLGLVVAIQSGWRFAAAISGVLIGASYLERPDALLLIVMAWAGLCALLAVRRFDGRAIAFAAGLAAVLPYGFLQAYDFAKAYTLANNVPTLAKVLMGMIGLAAIAVGLRFLRRPVDGVLAWSSTPSIRRLLSWSVVGLCAALMLLGGLRPLFGQDYTTYVGKPIRSYDEISFIRLTWFFSLPAMALFGAGIAYVALRRWRLDAWLVTLPAIGLTTLYCYHLKNSPYMMWATRRFVTTVVPGIVLLIGCGIALGLIVLRRYLPAVVGAVVAAVLLLGLATFNLRESWPLHKHNENGGSVEVVTQIASAAEGKKGIFLWQPPGYCCAAPASLFGGPLFSIADQSSAPLQNKPSVIPAIIKQYLKYAEATDRPLFYIADRTSTPPVVAGVTATKVTQLVGTLPHWEETFVSRPKKATNYSYDITIYRLTGS
jgi:hypothetical protein